MNAGVCGGACSCAGDAPLENNAQCALPAEPIILDEHGKCPCGKGTEECCHKDELGADEHDHVLGELCEAPGDAPLCGDDK